MDRNELVSRLAEAISLFTQDKPVGGLAALRELHSLALHSSLESAEGREWVSVEERLPSFDQMVIWRHKPSDTCHGVWEMDKDMDWQWVEERFGEYTPTHWRPLPEGPSDD